MPAPILGMGAGAAGGLETLLARQLAEERQKQIEQSAAAAMAEQTRHNQADEGLQGQNIQQHGVELAATAEDRKAQAGKIASDAADKSARAIERQKLIDDPNTPDQIRNYLKAEGGMEPGRTIPYQLITEPNGPPKTIPRPPTPAVHDTGNGLVRIGPEGAASPVLDEKGQPVKGYHAPPTPDRVLLQSGDSYIPRDQARQTLEKGGTVPLATSNTTRTMMEGASMLQPHIQQTQKMAEDLDKAGLFGPVMSRVRQVAAKAGTIDEFYDGLTNDPELKNDPKVGEFAATLGLLASGAGRVHGGARGGSSPQMYQNFKDLIADSGTLPMFEGRLKALDSFMQGYKGGPNPKTGGDTGGLPTVGGTFQGGKVLKVTPIQ